MATLTPGRKVVQTWSFRGSKSRNKVSVGEPAEGSLLNLTAEGVAGRNLACAPLGYPNSQPLCTLLGIVEAVRNLIPAVDPVPGFTYTHFSTECQPRITHYI